MVLGSSSRISLFIYRGKLFTTSTLQVLKWWEWEHGVTVCTLHWVTFWQNISCFQREENITYLEDIYMNTCISSILLIRILAEHSSSLVIIINYLIGFNICQLYKLISMFKVEPPPCLVIWESYICYWISSPSPLYRLLCDYALSQDKRKKKALELDKRKEKSLIKRIGCCTKNVRNWFILFWQLSHI